MGNPENIRLSDLTAKQVRIDTNLSNKTEFNMKRIFALAAAFAFSGSIAFAAITADDVVKTYQDAGYTRIEVTTGLTQIKVEAIKEGQKIEVIYDTETGDVVKTETSTLDPSVVVTPGVEVKTKDKDFVKGNDSDDDNDEAEDESEDDDHDKGDDHDKADDKDEDEHEDSDKGKDNKSENETESEDSHDGESESD